MARTTLHGQQVKDGSIELVDLSSALASIISSKADAGNLAPVATSGSYNDLTNLPTLFSGAYADLTGKPTLFSGSYNDLSDKPALFDGNYSSLSGKPALAAVATSGSYNDLSNLPTLFSGSYTDLTNKPILFSGSYNDLSDKPSIPSIVGLATETYVDNKVAALVDSAPAVLDTLNELAAALNDDPSFATTVAGQIGDVASDVSALDTRVASLEDDAFVTREVPAGDIDGSNAVFTLANTPVAGSEQVFVNGILQDSGEGNDYTISGDTITFADAPLSGWKIHVSYATGSYMVAPGGAASISSGGGVSVYNIPEFTHANPSNYSTYLEYTITHNQGKFPNKVQYYFLNSEGVYVDIFGLGTGNSYMVMLNTNQVKLYITRLGGGSSMQLAPKLFFFE